MVNKGSMLSSLIWYFLVSALKLPALSLATKKKLFSIFTRLILKTNPPWSSTRVSVVCPFKFKTTVEPDSAVPSILRFGSGTALGRRAIIGGAGGVLSSAIFIFS